MKLCVCVSTQGSGRGHAERHVTKMTLNDVSLGLSFFLKGVPPLYKETKFNKTKKL